MPHSDPWDVRVKRLRAALDAAQRAAFAMSVDQPTDLSPETRRQIDALVGDTSHNWKIFWRLRLRGGKTEDELNFETPAGPEPTPTGERYNIPFYRVDMSKAPFALDLCEVCGVAIYEGQGRCNHCKERP